MYMCMDLHCGTAGGLRFALPDVQYAESSGSYPRSSHLTGHKTSKWIRRKLCIFQNLLV